MASEKRASEGIALLSMYGDEDDEIEALDEEEEEIETETEPVPPSSDAVAAKDDDDIDSHGFRSNAEQQDERASPLQQQKIIRAEFDNIRVRKNRLAIVDYGHEEGALSPEAEDSEARATAQILPGEDLQTSDGEPISIKSPAIAPVSASGTQITSPQVFDQSDLAESDSLVSVLDARTEDVAMVSDEDRKDMELLEKFLPPPPKARCPQEVQDKIIKFIALKKTTGRNFNSEVRNRKEYRNPDFLLHAMTYQKIDQIGSCFSKDVFDPHGYDKSDFYDELEADMRREMERKEQERKKSQKIDFASAGVQPVNVAPTPKIVLPTPGAPNAAAASNASMDFAVRDGRQNKKSKWDKVDPDAKNPLSTGEKENPSVASQAKTGGGYADYARQRRRESEEKRAMDRKSDRRS